MDDMIDFLIEYVQNIAAIRFCATSKVTVCRRSPATYTVTSTVESPTSTADAAGMACGKRALLDMYIYPMSKITILERTKAINRLSFALR